jgi:hypothetical protein
MLVLIDKLWAWCLSNPLVAWPVFTAIVTFFVKPRSPARYAAMSAMYPKWFWSRFAPFLQLLGALGLDPVKATRAVMKIITGKQDSGAKIVAVIFFAFTFTACDFGDGDTRGALYATTLEECNRTSKTLCESIACENHARAANGRGARPVPTSCYLKDSGAKDSSLTLTDGGSHD